MARKRLVHPYLKDPLDVDYSHWAELTPEDLALLERLKEFLDEQERLEAERVKFHRDIWDAALDATGNPLFGCSQEAIDRHDKLMNEAVESERKSDG